MASTSVQSSAPPPTVIYKVEVRPAGPDGDSVAVAQLAALAALLTAAALEEVV